MPKHIKLKRGLNIRLMGEAQKMIDHSFKSDLFALKPTDFNGLSPKILAKVGQVVKCGEPIFFDKNNPEILFTAQTSGEILAVNRGERRKVLEIVIKSDGKNDGIDFIKSNPQELSREEIQTQLLRSGLWTFLKQRPYGTLANPSTTPSHIFISGFDSAPLAADTEFILKNQTIEFQTGIDALTKLTARKIHVGIRPEQDNGFFSQITGIEITRFSGPHPAGNVGVQIHHQNPIDKGQTIWTINPQEVVFIGRLFLTGKIDLTKTIAVTGSEVKEPKYYQVIHGTNLSGILKDATKCVAKERIITGNVLTGRQGEQDGLLGYFYQRINIFPKGEFFVFFGLGQTAFKT